MHECLTARDWIEMWGDPERDTHRLATCLECWPLRGDLAAWTAAVTECAGCSAALKDVPPLDDPNVLGCPACREAFARLHTLVEHLEHFDPIVAPEALAADELLGKLVKLSPGAQVARVTDDLRYQQWGLTQALLRSSRALWCSDPEIAHHRARVAATVADLLDPDTYHPQWTADLQAKAYSYLGNTHRVLADFREAERAFATAEQHLRHGVGGGRTRALVASLKGSLLIDQRRYMEAGALLDTALDYYRDRGTPEEIARTHLKRAMVAGALEEWRTAADLCSEATALLDPKEDRRLYTLSRQNSVEYLLHGGSVTRARQVFDELPPPYDRMLELRRLWIEGNLYRAEGALGAARVAYGSARGSYVEDRQHYHAGLVALDEAALALDTGHNADALTMAQEASILLVRGAARHEALAVLRVLLTALERGAADRALVLAAARRIAAFKPS